MTGTIQRIDYTRGSGLATMVLLDEVGDTVFVHCDAGPLFRSLEASGARLGTLINYTTAVGHDVMDGFALAGDGAQ